MTKVTILFNMMETLEEVVMRRVCGVHIVLYSTFYCGQRP
jgi:hypothetical protein